MIKSGYYKKKQRIIIKSFHIIQSSMRNIRPASFTIISLSLLAANQESRSAERWNILWLSCEDIDPILSCYGEKGISTPNIDRLAREGIRYTNAYAAVAVSGASRSSIITGMYPISIGTQNHRTGPHAAYRSPENETYKNTSITDQLGRTIPEYSAVVPEGVKCFSEYLRAAGYYCTNRDKCDYQFSCPMTAWDEIATADATYNSPNRPKGMPFFSVINYTVSHESFIWLNKDHPLLVNKDSVPIPAYFPEIEVVRKDVSRKYSNVAELDQQIGTRLADLESKGLLDSTIIIFFSDHGGPLLRQKRAVGNSGMRVPLIVRFPDKRMAGTVCSDIVSLMDLGPTMLSLTGVRPPDYMQGKAFLGDYRTATPKKYHFGSADRFDESRDMARSVLDGRFVYIKNFRPELPLIYRNSYREQIEMTMTLINMDKAGQLTGDAAYIFMKTKPVEELYDLVTDPDEVHNLAGKPEYQDKLTELRNALNQWIAEVGDKGAVPELDLIESMWPGLVQPSTAPVQYSKDEYNRIILSSATSSASIAYQKGAAVGTRFWKLYSGPLSVAEGEKITARAVRIGFKTSAATSYTAESTTLGIQENSINKNKSLVIYPNPVREKISVEFDVREPGKANLTVYDIRGKEILSDVREFPQGQNRWEYTFDETLKKGFYSVQIRNGQTTYSGKMIAME